MSYLYSSYNYAAIRKLRGEIETFEAQTTRTEADLAKQLHLANRRILELSTVVVALMETLVASGAVDQDVLDGRIENLVGELPWSADRPEPVTSDRPYTCSACFSAIAIADGTMTTSGMVCGACRGA